MAQKMMKGKFDLEDMLAQLRQIQKLGSMGSLIGMIPGLSRFKNQIEQAGVGDSLVKKQEAIILSMTAKERRNPDLIKASRKNALRRVPVLKFMRLTNCLSLMSRCQP